MSTLQEKIKSLKTLTKWIRYILYAQILIAILSIIFGFLERQLLLDFQAGIYTSIEAAFADGELAIMLLQGVGIASLIAFMASAVLIIKWIYRANFNVRHLGATNMSYTPAWSIGYYFIPIFNLWKPYQAMKEIWMTSKNIFDGQLTKTPLILPLWWVLWLSSNILNQSVFRLSAKAVELSELMNLNMLSQISNLIDIPLALVTLAIINSIYRVQSDS
ncbi:MAG: DUF4328 domain-containing protein [Psychromonas sp.]